MKTRLELELLERCDQSERGWPRPKIIVDSIDQLISMPWHFVVVRNRETLAAIGRIATQGAFTGQAPLAIAMITGTTILIDGGLVRSVM